MNQRSSSVKCSVASLYHYLIHTGNTFELSHNRDSTWNQHSTVDPIQYVYVWIMSLVSCSVCWSIVTMWMCVFELNKHSTVVNDQNVEEMLTHFTGSLTESGACCIILCYLAMVLVSTVRIHWIFHCSIWICDMCLCAIEWHRLFACVSIVVYCVFSFLFISYFLYSILVWVPEQRYHIDEHKCQEEEEEKKTPRRRKQRQYSRMKKNNRAKREQERIEWNYTYYSKETKCPNY